MHIESTEAKKSCCKTSLVGKNANIYLHLKHLSVIGIEINCINVLFHFLYSRKMLSFAPKYICLTLSPNTVSKLNENISIV